MAASTPDRIPSTPSPAAPKPRARKPSSKVLEAQQSLQTRTTTARPVRSRLGTTAPQPSRTEAASSAQQSAREVAPPCPTEPVSIPSEGGGRSIKLDEVVQLIASLKEVLAQQSNIITNQNSTIESIRADLTAIKAEQQYLKSQNAELQETIGLLRAQLDTLAIEAPARQTWASVAGSGRPAESGTTESRWTSARITDKEDTRQLVIDVSRVEEAAAEKVADTEAAKQAIQQGINNTERLAGVIIKDFRMWRANDSANVIKFSVDKDREAAFRQTTTEWLEPHILGARLVGPKWYPVKVDWIEVSLAMDIESRKVSKSAMERFGAENGVEVCTMRWLGRPRPSGQHASVVIKVATKEDAEKLLKSGSVTFGGGGTIVSPFEERRTPVACFKCRRFGHRARDCIRPETCDMCGQEGHLQCETTNLRCVNCQREHRASDRNCPAFWKEKERIFAIRQHT